LKRLKENPEFYQTLSKHIDRTSVDYLKSRPRGAQHYKYQHRPDRTKQCDKCGKLFDVCPSSIATRKFCSDECYKQGNRYNTKIEQAVEEILASLSISFKKQHKINKTGNARRYTFCDFFVEPNIVIFVDGDYWHNLPATVVRDTDTNKFLTEQNFEVIRIKGSQIKKSPEEVVHLLCSRFNKNIEMQGCVG